MLRVRPVRVAQVAQAIFVLIAALAVYSFVTAARDGERRRLCSTLCLLRPDYADINRTAPDFTLQSLDGRSVRLSDFRGKTVVLNFWTKTCRPCLEEMPSLGDFARRLGKKSDVVVVTISTDDTVDDVRDTLRSVLGDEVPFMTLVDPDAKVVTERYGTKLYPETWFIDQRGVIRARFDGPRDWTSPVALELATSLDDQLACPIQADQGRLHGEGSELCDELGG